MQLRVGPVVAGLVLAVVAAALGYLQVWPPVSTVMSGSMEPTIHTGDMVVLGRLHGTPHVGEVVAIPVSDAERTRFGYPPVVVHRVLKIADGRITSKGDALEHPDPFTTPLSVVQTHVVARIPAGGHVLAFLGSGLGLLWLAAGGVMLLLMPLLEKSRDAREHRTDVEGTALRAQLTAITEELTELRLEQIRERATQERRYDELVRASTAQIEALTAALLAGRETPVAPGGDAVAEAGDAVPAGGDAVAGAGDAVTGLPVLAQLALALVPGERRAPAVDASEPQLAFALDVERRPRFVRPSADQLELGLEEVAFDAGQLMLSTPPPPPRPAPPPPPPPPAQPPRPLGPPPPRSVPPPPAPPAVVLMKRRNGGLVGKALAWAVTV